MASLLLNHLQQPLEALSILIARPDRRVGRPGDAAPSVRGRRQACRRNKAHELPPIVGVERTQNKPVAARANALLGDPLILAIGNMWQNGSYSDKCRNIDAFEICHGANALLR